MGRQANRHSQERENTLSGQQGILVPESLEAAGQDRTDHRSSQMRSSDESVPIQGSGRGYRNVVWATLAWNTKKIVHLYRQREEKQALREMKRAA